MNRIKLARLAADLKQGRPLDPEGRAYLEAVLERALAGETDPFRLKPAQRRGRPPDPQLAQRHLAMALAVASKHWDKGLTLADACGPGANGGTEAKSFAKYRANLELCRLIYGARNVQRDMTPEESERLSYLLAEDLRRRGFGTDGK